MGFKQLPRIPVGADLSRTPPIYRPLPAVPLSRLIYETSLSALVAVPNILIKKHEYAVLRYEQYIARCPLKQEAPASRTGFVNVPENYGSVPDTRKGHHYIAGAARPKM